MTMKKLLAMALCLSLLLTSVAFAAEAENPIVDTTHGSVMGANVGGMQVYKGIPYGDDCDGEARFLAPEIAQDWEGVHDCTQTAPIAYQNSQSISASSDFGVYFGGSRPEEFGFNGIDEVETENCLVLSVATPKADDTKRPVIVYMHINSTAGAAGISSHQMAVANAEQGSANVYEYLIAYDSQLALYPGDDYRLAWHTADLPLQLRIVYYEESGKVSKLMSGAIEAFARTGDPSTEALAWPAFTMEDQMVMVWDDESRVESNPTAERTASFAVGE